MQFDQDVPAGASIPDTSAPRFPTGSRHQEHFAASLHFVTMCTYQRRHLFGDVIDGCMQLSDAGARAARIWEDIPKHHADTGVDAFVIMPNHIHGIVALTPPMERSAYYYSSIMLGEVVREFRARCIFALSRELGTPGNQVWQDVYHTHGICSSQAYVDAVEYIEANPQHWQRDIYYENPRAAICRAFSRSVGKVVGNR